MNIFQELKEKKDVLTKDGKVDALGPYGRQKLTGQEVAQYFKKNKVKDSKVKKAVEVALDLGGAMSVATKEIKKFFGNKILRSKEVQSALKYANESFEMNQLVGMLHEDVNNLTEKSLIPDLQKIVDTKGAAKVGGVMVDMFTASMITQIYDKVNDNNKKKMDKSKIEVLVNLAQKMMQKMEYDPSDIVEGRAMKPKQIAKKYKREIEQLAKKGQSPEMGRHKVYMALYNLAWENGDINTDDPDQTDEVIDEYLDDIMGEFFAHLESVKEGFKSELVEGKVLKFTKVKDKSLEKHLKVVTKKVGAKLEKISGGFAVSDTDMRGFTAVVDYIFDKSIKKNMLDGGGMSDVNMVSENSIMSYPKKNEKKIRPMLMKIAKKHPKVKVSFGTHSKGKFVDDNNINFKGQEKDIDMLMKDIQNNHKNLVKMMESPKLNLNVMDEYAKMYEDAVQKAREKQRLSDTHRREKEALAKKHARMKEQKELDEGMIDLDKARKLPDNIQKQILDLKKEYDRTWDGVFVPMGKEGSSQRKEYERRGKLFKAASKKYKDFLKKHKVATFK